MPVHHLQAQPPRGLLGDGATPITDPDVIAGYLSDASRRVGTAEALFRPTNEAEVAAVLTQASARGVAVTVVARQTSTTASSVPDGGWILSVEKLTAVGAVCTAPPSAWAQGGVILGELQSTLEGQGWLYPPDPTSLNECTLGASVACNASGACTFKYGPTRPWVRGMRVVLPTGGVLDIRRGEVCADGQGRITLGLLDGTQLTLHAPTYPEPHTKHAAGYSAGAGLDLIDVFIGSEGTLGVITEVEVKLTPLPASSFSLMAFFPDEASALSFVELARAQARGDGPLRPRCLEWLDAPSLDLIRSSMPELGVPAEAKAGLFSEQECDGSDPSELLEAWFEALAGCGALAEHETGIIYADSPAQLAAFRKARHAVPAGVNEQAARNGMPKVGTDLAVPDAALHHIMQRYHMAADDPRGVLPAPARARLLEKLGQAQALKNEGEDAAWLAAELPTHLETVTFGHIGDNHVHVNFLPTSPQGLALAKAVYAQLTLEAIDLGGTPSAEHGIGKIKVSALKALLGEAGMAQMRAVKQALDPAGCLGRGNLFGGASMGE